MPDSEPVEIQYHASLGLKLNPEMAELARKVADPQDLNEALLSVAFDNAHAQLVSGIERRAFFDLLKAAGFKSQNLST